MENNNVVLNQYRTLIWPSSCSLHNNRIDDSEKKTLIRVHLAVLNRTYPILQKKMTKSKRPKTLSKPTVLEAAESVD